MTGRDLKRILTSLISQRSQGPEFIKQWSLAIVLTAQEAETVRTYLHNLWLEDLWVDDEVFALLAPDAEKAA